jgi:hypothetical protein
MKTTILTILLLLLMMSNLRASTGSAATQNDSTLITNEPLSTLISSPIEADEPTFSNHLLIPRADVLSVGIGVGIDYSGYGGGVMYYPQQNIGLFASCGYYMVQVGVNAGIKLRTQTLSSRIFSPFLMAMYGCNSAVEVSNSQYNKIFYAPTLGCGFDLKFRPQSIGYLTFAVLFPIRGSAPNNYMNQLEDSDYVQIKNGFSTTELSIGYRFILQ